MSHAQLQLTALRAMEAAARLLSFKAAAQELHVTPTAISHQIQQLERSLGVELFVRVHRGLTLTPAAQACLPHIRDGFASLRAAVIAIQEYKDVGTLSVSAPPSFAMRILMPLSQEFLAQYPDIDLRITTRMRVPVQEAARPQDETETFRSWAEESDIVIVLGKDGFGDLDAEELMPLAVQLVCSPALLENGKGLREAADVQHYPWLHDDRGLKYGGAPFWDQWLSSQGVSPREHGHGAHFNHAAMAIEAAVKGMGLLVTTPCLCWKELRNGELVTPLEHAVPIENSYFVLNRRTQRPAAELFKQWLRARLQDRSLVANVSDALPAG